MQTRSKIYGFILIILALVVCNIYLFNLDFKEQKNSLTFAMLDVGQGDGIFIESPTGVQVMFDAGPQHKITGALSRSMPPFDKSIDAVIITNPDADHIGGFAEVLKNYKVGLVLEPGTFNESRTYQNLETEIKRQNIPDVLVKKGMRLDIGGGAFIDILFPDRDVSSFTSNDGSIIARLTYGSTSIMLTGDTTTETEKIILGEFSKEELHSTILKVGHHGSRTSSSSEFVQAVSPKYAVISDGKDNKYGHPHPDTLNTLEKVGAQVFRTDLLGSIIMKSDGQKEVFSFIK